MHPVSFPRMSKDELNNFIAQADSMSLDVESNSLDFLNTTLLLISMSDGVNTVIVDAVNYDLNQLSTLKDKLIIGHNFIFDYCVLRSKGGPRFTNIYDTLIVEQRIRKGAPGRNSLDHVMNRRLGVPMSKDIRKEFMRMNGHSIFEDRHIAYSGGDVTHMHKLLDVQLPLIKEHKLSFLLYDIEFPLIPILGEAMVTGFNFNKDHWMSAYYNSRKLRDDSALRLDEIVRGFDLRGPSGIKITGKYTRPRKRAYSEQTTMFGVPAEEVTNENKGNLNYDSTPQIMELMELCGEQVPVVFDPKQGTEKKSLGSDQVEQWIYENPNSKFKPFMEELLVYKLHSKRAGTFGRTYMDKFVRPSGRIHTWYNQCATITGRLSSGNTEHGYINSQQIPKSTDFRHAFIADPGHTIMTIDLSRAELIILGSLSGDHKLLALQAEDIHSYLANAVYTKLLSMNLPVSTLQGYLSTDSFKATPTYVKEVLESGLTIKNEKGWRKDLRTRFKNVVYGTAYGAGAKKIAETLGVQLKHGEVALDVLKAELPETFAFLETNAKKGLRDGKIVFNERTNSFRWFSKVVLHQKMTKGEMEKIARDCKNSPIQGTQADMVKEAIVKTHEAFPEAQLLLQVHDEGVYQLPTDRAEEMAIQIQQIWNDTASAYLNGFRMNSEYELLPYWTK